MSNEWIDIANSNIIYNDWRPSKNINLRKITLNFNNLNISSDSNISNEIINNIKSDPIPLQIKKWASSDKNVDEMIFNYNKKQKIWEKPTFFINNIRLIIDELSKNWRYDVLNYLRLNNPSYSNKNNYIHTGASPFHKLVWPSKFQAAKMNDTSIDNIKKTFFELQYYGFNVFLSNKNKKIDI
jgi:hypothetical protein